MESRNLHIRRPKSPADALTSELSDELEVVVLPGGRVAHPVPANNKIYDEDPVFLRAVIDALLQEIEGLEKEIECLSPASSATKASRPLLTRSRK